METPTRDVARSGVDAPAHDPAGDAWVIRDALVATGMAADQMVVQITECLGVAAAHPLIREWIAGSPRPSWSSVMDVLDRVAVQDPDSASALLGDFFHVSSREDGHPAWPGDVVLGGPEGSGGWVRSLPAGLMIAGDLDLEGCESLEALPQGLEVGGDLYLMGCSALTTLPDHLRVGGELRVVNCPSLTGMPHDLRVGDSVLLKRCPSLAGIAPGMRVQKNLKIGHCDSLRTLPSDLSVGQSLLLESCGAFQSIPEGTLVGDTLEVRACGAFTSLPDGVQTRWLAVVDCPVFSGLPRSMVLGRGVMGGMILTQCPSWDGHIPDDAQITGMIRTERHTGPLSLEDWRARHPWGERPVHTPTPTHEDILGAIEAAGGYVTGDCAVFALALANLLGEEACDIVFSDGGEGTPIGHVAVAHGGHLYDGDGLCEEADLLAFVDDEDGEGSMPELVRIPAMEIDAGALLSGTNPSHGVGHYRDILSRHLSWGVKKE